MDYFNVTTAFLSVLAMLSTFYFWLVSSKKERARLKTYLVEMPHFGGHFGWQRDTDNDQGGAPGVYRLAYFRLAVANYSSLPNAILGYSFSVKAKDGSWKNAPVYHRYNDLKTSELPLNIPPLQTVPLEVWLRIWVDDPEEKTGFFSAIAEPAEVKVELHPLGLRTDLVAVRWPFGAGGAKTTIGGATPRRSHSHPLVSHHVPAIIPLRSGVAHQPRRRRRPRHHLRRRRAGPRSGSTSAARPA